MTFDFGDGPVTITAPTIPGDNPIGEVAELAIMADELERDGHIDKAIVAKAEARRRLQELLATVRMTNDTL